MCCSAGFPCGDDTYCRLPEQCQFAPQLNAAHCFGGRVSDSRAISYFTMKEGKQIFAIIYLHKRYTVRRQIRSSSTFEYDSNCQEQRQK